MIIHQYANINSCAKIEDVWLWYDQQWIILYVKVGFSARSITVVSLTITSFIAILLKELNVISIPATDMILLFRLLMWSCWYPCLHVRNQTQINNSAHQLLISYMFILKRLALITCSLKQLCLLIWLFLDRRDPQKNAKWLICQDSSHFDDTWTIETR
jgi:hypothetical protein